MASKTVTVGSTVGLHARPATLIADAAAEYDEEILIELVESDDDDEPADAASSLMIMALGAEHGDQVCPAKWQPGAETLRPSLDLVGQL